MSSNITITARSRFKLGDVVRLKGDDTTMTIDSFPSLNLDEVSCVWLDNDLHLQRAHFNFLALELA